MYVLKSGGKVYGAKLTSNEQKALNIEIQKELVEYNDKNMTEFDAMILWILHTKLGFGKTRLRRFFNDFRAETDALKSRYLLGNDGDFPWLCTRKLKDELGIDLKEWESE